MQSKRIQIREFITSDNVSLPLWLNPAYDVSSDNAVDFVEYFEARSNKTRENVAVATPTASSSNKVTSFLGILNKDTNKVRCVEVSKPVMIKPISCRSNINDVGNSIVKKPDSKAVNVKEELIEKNSCKEGVRVLTGLNINANCNNEILQNQNESPDFVKYFEAINKTRENVAVATPTASSGNKVTSFLGILNENANKVRCVEVSKPVMIKPISCRSNINDVGNSIVKKPDSKAVNVKEELIEKFSCKEGVRVFKRLNINANCNNEILQNQNESPLYCEVKIEDYHKSIRPPINKAATKIENLYLIHDVIPQNILDNLNDECVKLISTDLDIPSISLFIIDRIKNVKNSNDPFSNDNINRLKMCIYLDGLINLLRTRFRIMEHMHLSDFSMEVEYHIKRNFRDPRLVEWRRTEFTVSKALCYSIVLAMLLSKNNIMNATYMTKVLGVDKKRLMKHCHAVNVVSDYGSDLLRFVLPRVQD